jgi:hypothetical protein
MIWEICKTVSVLFCYSDIATCLHQAASSLHYSLDTRIGRICTGDVGKVRKNVEAADLVSQAKQHSVGYISVGYLKYSN